MKRVTGIGGIFFKAKDAPSLRAWYNSMQTRSRLNALFLHRHRSLGQFAR